ncbi:hypothetical protein DFH06DRAFT_1324833 [Mycena polygramma]|nr:hypothetical protein DFH06DRAFT_1324833 [Mycena polygramma]
MRRTQSGRCLGDVDSLPLIMSLVVVSIVQLGFCSLFLLARSVIMAVRTGLITNSKSIGPHRVDPVPDRPQTLGGRALDFDRAQRTWCPVSTSLDDVLNTHLLVSVPALVVYYEWKPYETRDVEDFLSLLDDLHHLTIVVTLRAHTLLRNTRDLLDIQCLPGFDQVLGLMQNNPHAVTEMASFEGCLSLITHWEQEGPALSLDKPQRNAAPQGV